MCLLVLLDYTVHNEQYVLMNFSVNCQCKLNIWGIRFFFLKNPVFGIQAELLMVLIAVVYTFCVCKNGVSYKQYL